MSRIAVQTTSAPTPVGSYSQGARRGALLQVAGQGGTDPATGKLVPGGVAEQTARTLRNIEAILASEGATFADVIMVRVYLAQADDFAAMDAAYGAFLGRPFPARTTVVVGLLSGMLVEIDALAVLPDR
ncbi:RidA family protein [Streptomyces sp. NRRL S-350]|uniref:RidA family protein n=1 Tax=Streptomyces sp. NRRL S-350 TaxID=1463902 RepID=UPI0004C0D6A6|nr:Rid family hydrolase [Streptomyces sp. NRRL S-350]